MMNFQWIIFAGLSALTGYFGYHALYGERGYVVWQEKKHLARTLQEELRLLQLKKNILSRKISLIHTQIDLDLLEQLAWALFRYTDPQKRVILYH